MAIMEIETQKRNYEQGHGVEHPCYSCLEKCGARKVGYHNNKKRFIVEPTEGPPIELKSILNL